MEISRAFKIVSFCISDFEGPSFLRTCSGFFSFAAVASLLSLEYNSLDDEAERLLTEAAKTRGVALEI